MGNDTQNISRGRVDHAIIEHLAADEAMLRERIESLETDNATLRAIVSETLTALHAVTGERNQVREQLARLRAEYRWLREQRMQEAA